MTLSGAGSYNASLHRYEFTGTSAVVTVNNLMPGTKYVFDYGVIPVLNLFNESLMVEITYTDPMGDTHVYWDSPSWPSALLADGTVPNRRTTWGNIKALYR